MSVNKFHRNLLFMYTHFQIMPHFAMDKALKVYKNACRQNKQIKYHQYKYK